jgi:hypothetical protein
VGVDTRVLLACLAVVALGACSPSDSGGGPRPQPSGPPTPEASVIDDHATQFADELARRPAGSQQEQIAATYILGHLQQAGYPARLDAVPVGDLVRSTNVIGVPPQGDEPRYVIAVPYDTPRGQALDAHAIGVFLEVARALSVRDLDHAVEFVALVAEFTEQGEGSGGSRALVERLTDEGIAPEIVYLSPTLILGGAPGDGFYAEGSLADQLEEVTTAEKQNAGPAVRSSLKLYEEAGFEATLIGGVPEVVAQKLIEFLADG